MLRKRTFILLLMLLSIVALVFSSQENDRVTEISKQPSVSYVAAEGRVSVKADRRVVLSAEVPGRIDRILVDTLHPVKAGQLLAVLSNADLERRIQQTEALFKQQQARYLELARGSRMEDVEEAAANVRRAEADLELAIRNEQRDQKLMEQEVLAKSRYDVTIAERKKAESQLEAAREKHSKLLRGERSESIEAARAEMNSGKFALEAMRAEYEKTFIRSPLDGVVLFRYRNASEFADAGDRILEVADLSEIIVEGDVNEIDAGRVQTVHKVVITSDAFPESKFEGEVYEVNAALKKRSSEPENPAVIIDQKVLPIKVRFIKPVPLKLGMKVDLKIYPTSAPLR